MKKLLVVLVVLMLLPVVPVQAQSDPLVCDQFVDSATNIRVAYYMGEGGGYFEAGNLSAALDRFSCITNQIDPSYVPALMSRAAVYAEYRDYEKSITDYTTAIGLNGSFAPAYNNRGIVYAAMNNYDLALADFNQVISLDSANVTAYNNRAVVYAIQGEYADAIADLQQALSISGIGDTLIYVRNPERNPEEPLPVVATRDAQSYALLGIVYERQAQAQYSAYLELMRERSDARIQSAAGALESRFNFELRLEDGTWLFVADFSPSGS
jgi:tetratricopeptide (TPR) repeat protein